MASVAPLPRTRRWTRAEYERLVALGVFQSGERLDPLDGHLLVREPQGSRHAGTIRRVLAPLRARRRLAESLLIDSSDHREGLAAFFERRPPRFTGA